MKLYELEEMIAKHQVECPVVKEANSNIESLCYQIRSLIAEVDNLRNSQGPSEQQVMRAVNLARHLTALYEKEEVAKLLGSELRNILEDILLLSAEERKKVNSE